MCTLATADEVEVFRISRVDGARIWLQTFGRIDESTCLIPIYCRVKPGMPRVSEIQTVSCHSFPKMLFYLRSLNQLPHFCTSSTRRLQSLSVASKSRQLEGKQ